MLGWIDFSKTDRNIAFSVLRLLSEPGAVDELGIGTIRDGFANILFPGISTLQTHAKYLFIVPYICMELQRIQGLSPREFIELLYKNEIELIKPLIEHSGKRIGVIGEDAGEKLLRKPSALYWSALRTCEFFTENSFSLSEYASVFCRLRDSAIAGKNLGREDNADDADAFMSETAFWSVPFPEKDWRDKIVFKPKPIHTKVRSGGYNIFLTESCFISCVFKVMVFRTVASPFILLNISFAAFFPISSFGCVTIDSLGFTILAISKLSKPTNEIFDGMLMFFSFIAIIAPKVNS